MGYIRVRGKTRSISLRFKWAEKWREERSGFKCTGTGSLNCKCPGHNGARLKLAEVEHNISAGFFDYRKTFPKSKIAARMHRPDTSRDVTFRRRADLWLENKSAKAAPGTVLNYRSNVRKLVSWFDDALIRDIRPSDIESLVAHHAKDLSGKSIQNLLGVLSGILASAVKDRVIPDNPVALVSNRPKINRDPPDVYTRDEVLAMLDYCIRSKDPRQARFAVILALGAFVGCRIYESIAMKTDCVWLRRRKLKIEWNLSGRQLTKVPKTERSRRTVDIPAAAFPYIKMAYDMGGEFLFPNERGSHYTDSNFIGRKYWRPMLETLGLPVLDIRTFRHTFINLAIRAGADFAWIRDQVGHTDLKMIMAHYANVQQEFPGSGIPAFDRFVKEGPENLPYDLPHVLGRRRTPTE